MFKTMSSWCTAALSAHGSRLALCGFSNSPKLRIGPMLLDGASTGIVDEPDTTGYAGVVSGVLLPCST